MEIPETRYVLVDGRKMAYDEVCPPDPKGMVLLLSGLASKRIGWARQRAVFGQVYRIIALDHRDSGDSDSFTAPYTIADQADDAAAVLRALGIARTHVVGISMGGFVALDLALRYPDLVDKLVLTSTSAGGKTHVHPQPHDIVRMTWPGLVYREPGRRAQAVYARIMAPGYCRRHPDDWQQIAEVARYRPQSSASYQRQWQACQRHDVAARLGGSVPPRWSSTAYSTRWCASRTGAT